MKLKFVTLGIFLLLFSISACTQEEPKEQTIPAPYLTNLSVVDTTAAPVAQIDFGTDGELFSISGGTGPVAEIFLTGGGMVDGSSYVNRCRVRKDGTEYVDYCSIAGHATAGTDATIYLFLIPGSEQGEYLISLKRDDLPWSNELAVTVH